MKVLSQLSTAPHLGQQQVDPDPNCDQPGLDSSYLIPDAAKSTPYVGRFAPSPTGLLHFGSLMTAVASYLDARSHSGKWIIRIEDIDLPRVQPGASQAILNDLALHGLISDDPVIFQSHRQTLYQEPLVTLIQQGKAFKCSCSRKDLEPFNQVHPAQCPAPLDESAYAIRLQVPSNALAFVDRIQGPQRQQLDQDVGAFVIRRKDQLFSYQLAVVIDDAIQGVNQIVRGIDLIDSTARQLWLHQCLGIPSPRYLHLPLAVNRFQQKLSKQNRARPLDCTQPLANLKQACHLLGIPLAAIDQSADTPQKLLHQAIKYWNPEKLPRTRYPGHYR